MDKQRLLGLAAADVAAVAAVAAIKMERPKPEVKTFCSLLNLIISNNVGAHSAGAASQSHLQSFSSTVHSYAALATEPKLQQQQREQQQQQQT